MLPKSLTRFSAYILGSALFLTMLLGLIQPAAATDETLDQTLQDMLDQQDESESSGTTSGGLGSFLQFDPGKNDPALTSSTRLTFLSGGNDPASIAFNIINIGLSFLGTLSTIIILYAGVIWFLAGDNEEKITQAKQILLGAVIGLVIALSSLGLSSFLFTRVAIYTGIATS